MPLFNLTKWVIIMSNANTSVAPNVIDTIVTLAVTEVPGVAFVGSPVQSGLRALVTASKNTSGVSVVETGEDSLDIAVSVHINNGFSVDQIVSEIRSSVVDAVLTQAGRTVARVDILIDGIVF